jgi:hypothetical protein
LLISPFFSPDISPFEFAPVFRSLAARNPVLDGLPGPFLRPVKTLPPTPVVFVVPGTAPQSLRLSGITDGVERSDTLQSGSWTTVQDNIAGTDGLVQITDAGASAQSRRFYRVILP